MATTVGALSVDLDLNSANFINNMKKAVDGVDKSSKAMASSLSFAKSALAGFLAGFTADKIGEVIGKGLEYASSLGEQAQQLGVTTREMQVYRYAASQVGVSNEEMDKGLAKLTLSIGKAASGNKQLSAVFSSLGIAVADATGQTRPAGDVMEDLADKLSKVSDPAKRAQIEVALFGKTGQKLDTLLTGGSAAINDMASAADRLGIVLSDKLINQADEAADKLAAMKQVISAKIAAEVAENASAILTLADAMATMVEWAGKAANAYKRFKMEQGIREAQAMQSGWFRSAKDKAEGAANEGRFRRELYLMDHPNSTLFGLRLPAKGAAPPRIDTDTPEMGGGGGGGRSRAARRSAGGGRTGAGPTLEQQFAQIEKSLDPVKAANLEFEKNVEVLRKMADQGKITTARYNELHDALFADWQNSSADTALERAPRSLQAMDEAISVALPNIENLKTQLREVPTALDEAFDEARMAGVDAMIGSIENLRHGFGSLKDVALNVIDEIEHAILEKIIYGPLRDWAAGGGGSGGGLLGGILGSAGDLLGAVFGGKRALGGSVSAGRVYRVGEQGEELFSPGVSGTIIPNSALQGSAGGAGGGNTYHISGNLLTPEFWQQIQAMDTASAHAGSELALQRINRRQSRRLGG